MTVKKEGGKWKVKHCSGGRRGTIGTHATKREAVAQHRAIKASKKKKK